MPIRIEIYAKDQVTASAVVEYALSHQAILQSYSVIDPPLERANTPEVAPKRAYKKRGVTRRTRRDYVNTIVKVVDRTNGSLGGSKRWGIIDVILRHDKAVSLRKMQKQVEKEIPNSESATVRQILRALLDSGQLEEQ